MLKKSSFEVDKNFHIIQQQQFQDTVFSMNVVSQNTINTIHNPTQHNMSSYGKKTNDSIAQFEWKSMDVRHSQRVSKNYIIMIIHLYKLVRVGHMYSMNMIIHQWRTKKESVDK